MKTISFLEVLTQFLKPIAWKSIAILMPSPRIHLRSFTTYISTYGCVLYLLLFCSSTCSLLLSAERILGSTRDSNVSNITGSTSFSRACSVFTYWHRYMKTHICVSECHLISWQRHVSSRLDTLIHRHTVSVVCLTLCCSMASSALNSKGRECVCDASWGARSSTNQRSNPSPRKSNTNRDCGVTMAFKDCGETEGCLLLQKHWNM